MWCKKRITNQTLLVRFKDGKHRFYLEAVCGEPASNGVLCSSCYTLKPQTKTQDVKTFDHGIVGEEYPPTSHIFESPWYTAKVKAYGPPSNEELELAMEARKRATAGTKTKAMKDLVAALAKTSPVQKPVEPVQKVDSLQLPPVMTPEKTKREESTQNESTKKSTKPRAPRKKKDTDQPTNLEVHPEVKVQSNVITTIPETITMAETMDEPIKVNQVLRIILKNFTHNDVSYWRDSEREKLYKKTKDGKKGEYIGRWDSVEHKIVKEAPDSDQD